MKLPIIQKILLIALLIWIFIVWFTSNYEIKRREDELINPFIEEVESDKGILIKVYTIDEMINVYAEKYANDKYSKDYLKQLLHCVVYRESNYGKNKNFGDNGKAGGICQFHEATYKEYRNIMIKRGLVDSSGSRMNYENAIETTAWAIADGRGNAWGCILRGECE